MRGGGIVSLKISLLACQRLHTPVECTAAWEISDIAEIPAVVLAPSPYAVEQEARIGQPIDRQLVSIQVIGNLLQILGDQVGQLVRVSSLLGTMARIAKSVIRRREQQQVRSRVT